MESQSFVDERGRIPNILKIGEIPTDSETIDYDTEVLDPVINGGGSAGSNFVRFVIPNKGILHSFSKITLGISSGTGAGALPANIGVHSLVQRATLRIGTSIIAEIDDFSYYMAYKSVFIHNPINMERETYTTSRIINNDIFYDNTATSESNINASGYALSTTVQYEVEANGIDAELLVQRELKTGAGSVFAISIADLFPMLREHQLPLYLINDQVSIELHLTTLDSKKRAVFNAEEGENTNSFDYTLDETQTKFIADYLYYTDGDVMNRFAAQNVNNPIEFDYPDFRLNKRTLTQAQAQTSSTIDIGGAGRFVRKVITSIEGAIAAGPDSSITNTYNSYSPTVNNGNNAVFETNLIYNDSRLYPINRKLPSVHYSDLMRTEMNIPNVSKAMFSKEGEDGGFVHRVGYLGRTQGGSLDGLLGRFFYIAYDVGAGNQRVNSRGIQLELNYNQMIATTFTHRAWVELLKVATLKNGVFTTMLK